MVRELDRLAKLVFQMRRITAAGIVPTLWDDFVEEGTDRLAQKGPAAPFLGGRR